MELVIMISLAKGFLNTFSFLVCGFAKMPQIRCQFKVLFAIKLVTVTRLSNLQPKIYLK